MRAAYRWKVPGPMFVDTMARDLDQGGRGDTSFHSLNDLGHVLFQAWASVSTSVACRGSHLMEISNVHYTGFSLLNLFLTFTNSGHFTHHLAFQLLLRNCAFTTLGPGSQGAAAVGLGRGGFLLPRPLPQPRHLAAPTQQA